jgi:lysophospholipase L1-like esterase
MFTVSSRLPAFALLAGLLAAPLVAQDKKKEAGSDEDNPAARPAPKKVPYWKLRHEKFLKRARKGHVDLVFLGDSITHGWERNGKAVWKKTFEPLKAVNFGIGADQTGTVLWRITEGKELEPIKPKAVVLLIGTYNLEHHTPRQIAGGVKAILDALHKRKPRAKVLLLGIFPKGPTAKAPFRKKIKATNELLAKLADGKTVFYKDIGDRFVQKDGRIDTKIMYDTMHLTPKGYQLWADAILPDVKKMLE